VFKDGYEYGLGSISVAGGNETRNIRLLPTASALTGEGTIGGTVLDSLGLPIPDASVYVSAPGFPGGYQSAYTDENGHFDLTDLPLGDLSLEVTQPSIGFVSYASYSADVHLTLADPAVNLDIVLADAASIAGVVTSDTGEITGNLVAEAIDAASGEVVRVGQVDWISGEYLLGQLPASDYIVRIAQQSGFQQTPDLPDPSLSLGQSYWVVGDPDGSAERDDATLVTLVAGDDAVGRDLLVRQGGSIGGYVDVATADGTIPLPAGRIIRVNVYHLEGSDWQLLDFATAETSQYSASEFIASGLATGAYKLEFVDMWEGNRAYVTTYENGAATLEDAPSILVVAGAVTHTGTTTLTVVAPADDPFSVDLGALSDEELAGLEDGITTDGEPTAGEETEINVGEDFAGEWVAVWGNSTPTKISDWVQVATDGTIVVTLPSTLIGSHKVIVQDADQQPLGWAPVEIAAPTPASTGGSGTTTTPPAKPRTNGSLATTPTPTTTTPAPTEETESPDERIPVTGNAADEPEVTAEAGFNFVPIWALLAALLLALIVGGVVIVRRRAA
jgi:hypothetical protein